MQLSPDRFKDLKVSGFTGANLKDGGGLAQFLAARQANKIAAGSALIVEAFDRLTRLPPRRALALLIEILDAKIEVHFTRSGKVFLPESTDGMELMLAVAEATAGYQESAKKSVRLLSAFKAKREAVAAGQPAKIQGCLPWWLEATKKKKIICPPAKAALLTRIFELMAGGSSTIKIAATLNAEPDTLQHLSPKKSRPPRWNPATICRTIKSTAPAGLLRTPHGDFPGYYPAVIPRALAGKALAMLASNSLVEIGRRPKPGRLKTIVKGLLREASTGTPFSLYWVQGKTKQTGYYLARNHTTCKMVCKINAAQLEGVLVASLSELTVEQIAPAQPAQHLREQKRLEKEIADVGGEIYNMKIAVKKGVESFTQDLMDAEAEQKKMCAELEKIKLESPRPVDRRLLDAVKSYAIADLQIAQKREEIAIALRKLIANISLSTAGTSQLALADADCGKFIGVVLGTKPPGQSFQIPDPTPIRGRREVALLIAFRTGGKRLVIRTPGSPIVSLRVD